MKRILILFTIFFVLILNIKSQEKTFDYNKLAYGGTIGFAISSTTWRIGGSPHVLYKLSNKFSSGIGLTYIHAQSRNDVTYDYKENSIGLNFIMDYYPWRKVIVRLKPEVIHTWYESKGYITEEKYKANKFVPTTVIGAGLNIKPITIMLNYELIQNKYSPYSDNVFFSFGILI